jgi:hypothetical protein
MLEKLFGVGSFNGSIDHLAHYHAILIVFSGELGLLPMVQIIAPTFSKCWALIVPAFVTRF